ncbi:MAG: ATP-binding cassette domain-containing protein [Bacteroidetes bacterium]|nr:ATP-binding cassette domain-containing protein [Bacteroidota bacterium]
MPDQALVLDTIFYEAPALRILQGAYLKVEPGQICGLFGRNGSGKTTLLKVAAGQIRPASGLVIIDGERFAAPQRRRRFAKLAYLPQTPMLPPSGCDQGRTWAPCRSPTSRPGSSRRPRPGRDHR